MAVVEQTGVVAPFEVNLGDESTEFSGSVRMLTEVAGSFGVIVTPQELRDWQTLGRAAYVIDQYLDAEKDSPRLDIAVELFSDIPIPGIPTRFTDDCRQWLERQPEDRQAEIWRQLFEIRGLVEAQAAATTVSEVVAIRRAESDILADMLSLQAAGGQDAAGRHKFNTWLAKAMRAGYLFDSVRDIKEDFETGASGVEPKLGSYARMGSYLLKDTVKVAAVSQ